MNTPTNGKHLSRRQVRSSAGSPYRCPSVGNPPDTAHTLPLASRSGLPVSVATVRRRLHTTAKTDRNAQRAHRPLRSRGPLGCKPGTAAPASAPDPKASTSGRRRACRNRGRELRQRQVAPRGDHCEGHLTSTEAPGENPAGRHRRMVDPLEAPCLQTQNTRLFNASCQERPRADRPRYDQRFVSGSPDVCVPLAAHSARGFQPGQQLTHRPGTRHG